MSSGEIKTKIATYENIIRQLKLVNLNIDDCLSEVIIGSDYAKEVIINGESIDKGELVNVSVSLSLINGNMNTIIGECNNKIADLQILLQQVLAEETKRVDDTRLKAN